MTTTPTSSASHFPERINPAMEPDAIITRLEWGPPVLWMCCLPVVLLCWEMRQEREFFLFGLGTVAVALLGVLYEIRRRRRRISLMIHATSDETGFYRGGVLQHSFLRSQIVLYKLDWFSTGKVLILLAILAMIPVGLGVDLFLHPHREGAFEESVGMAYLGFVVLFCIYAVVRSRLRTKWFWVPDGKSQVCIAFSRADANKLLGSN